MELTTILIFFTIAVIAIAAMAIYFYKKNTDSKSDTTAKPPSKETITPEVLSELCLKSNKSARLNGVAQITKIEELYDSIFLLTEYLSTLTETEYKALISIPGDIERLLEVHLVELNTKFSRVRNKNEDDISKINATYLGMKEQIDYKIKLIQERNITSANEAVDFLSFRYSDKY